MKMNKFANCFALAVLAAAFCIPAAGCGGVEDEPLGVEATEEEQAELESEEYIEGEEGV